MIKGQSKQIISGPQANTIVQGDCVEVLRGFRSRSVDFVLTDPPYLAHSCSRDSRRVANDGDAAWLKPAFAEMFRVLRRDSFCVSFYGWHQADKFIAAWREAGFRLAGLHSHAGEQFCTVLLKSLWETRAFFGISG